MPYIFLHGLGQDLLCWNDVLKFLKISEIENMHCPSLCSFFKKRMLIMNPYILHLYPIVNSFKNRFIYVDYH